LQAGVRLHAPNKRLDLCWVCSTRRRP